jgi:hypothetical protein
VAAAVVAAGISKVASMVEISKVASMVEIS